MREIFFWNRLFNHWNLLIIPSVVLRVHVSNSMQLGKKRSADDIDVGAPGASENTSTRKVMCRLRKIWDITWIFLSSFDGKRRRNVPKLWAHNSRRLHSIRPPSLAFDLFPGYGGRQLSDLVDKLRIRVSNAERQLKAVRAENQRLHQEKVTRERKQRTIVKTQVFPFLKAFFSPQEGRYLSRLAEVKIWGNFRISPFLWLDFQFLNYVNTRMRRKYFVIIGGRQKSGKESNFTCFGTGFFLTELIMNNRLDFFFILPKKYREITGLE